MVYRPTDIMNQALDAMGWETTIGDAEEGSREARVLLRAYRECLRQMLRGAHWDWARKTAPLTLLADATGQTQNVGTIVKAFIATSIWSVIILHNTNPGLTLKTQ